MSSRNLIHSYTLNAVVLSLMTIRWIGSASGAESASGIPRIVKTGDRYQWFVDGKPFLMLGGQVGNRTSTPELMAGAWPAYEAYGANTVEFPVHWNAVEPEEGKFDFSMVEGIIRAARSHGLHVIPLWFATWKGNDHDRYIPPWVLNDKTRFPRAIDANGKEMRVPSPHSEAVIAADRRAFTELMKYIKAIDETEHTVVLVQVENEPGILGSVRDYSAQATRLFNGRVPESILHALRKQPGTWREVFGPRLAEEAFASWSIAHFINEVAGGGKKVYPLPMYVNVWMGGGDTNDRFYEFDYPGSSYPSGGAQSHMLDVWKASAPNINVIAPDIYHHSIQIYRTILELYTRPDNPLLIVETGRGLDFARYCFMAIGDYGAIGFAQFGIGGARGAGGGRGRRGGAPGLQGAPGQQEPPPTQTVQNAEAPPGARGAQTNAAPGGLSSQFADVGANYKLFRAAMPALVELRGTPRLKAVIEQQAFPAKMLYFDNYDVHVMFPPALQARQGAFQPTAETRELTGRVLIGQTAPDEFLVLGFDAAVEFQPSYGGKQKTARLVLEEEGAYDNASWKPMRPIEPGDRPNRVMLPATGAVIKARLERN